MKQSDQTSQTRRRQKCENDQIIEHSKIEIAVYESPALYFLQKSEKIIQNVMEVFTT